MAEVLIRPGIPDDAPSLADLGAVVTAATYHAIDPDAAVHTLETWWTPQVLRTSIENTRHWIAQESTGRIVGIANLGRKDGRLVVWKLYVHPDRQGSGLGRRLLASVVEAVHEAGDHELWLSYLDGNDRAAGFYAAHGFAEQHREPDPPYPDQVWMRRPV